MSTQIQRRRGTTAQHASFTGVVGETTVDTDKDTVVVHDGTTVGGFPLMRENGSNSALALGSAATPSLKFTGDTNTGIYSPGADQVSVATGGTERLRIDSTGQIEAVSLGTAAAPTFSFTGDPNTGIYSPAADQVAISTGGSGRLFVDASGNVKVGSTDNSNAATQYITVGSVGVTDGGLQLWARTNGQSYVQFGDTTTSADQYRGYLQYSHASDFLALGTASQERLRIDSSGRVGVGTSVPVTQTHIVNNGGVGTPIDVLRVQSEGAYFNVKISPAAHPTDALTTLTAQSGGGGNSSNSAFAFNTRTSGTESEKVRIDSSGRVGIGDNAPGTFDVRGAKLTLADSTSDGIGIKGRKDSLDRWYVGYNSSDHLEVNQIRNNALVFKTNNAEVARLTNSGQLLVGTSSTTVQTRLLVQGSPSVNHANLYLTRANTTPASGDPIGYVVFSDSNHSDAAYVGCNRDGGTWTTNVSMPTRLVFSVTRDGASSPTEALRIENTGRSMFRAANAVTYIESAAGAGTTDALITGAHSSGTISLRVWTNGNIQNTNNSYTAISDIKLKENIVDANSQWDDIKALQVRNYNLKEGQTHKQIGLIAQEVEPISPGLVYESPDRDEDGNDLGTVTKSVNYSVLYMKAVKALQEAMERIEQLEAKVSVLESKP